MSQPQLHRTVSGNIFVNGNTVRTSPPTDNCPQPKEALLTVSKLDLPFKLFDSSAL
jgi:hypothetical protein